MGSTLTNPSSMVPVHIVRRLEMIHYVHLDRRRQVLSNLSALDWKCGVLDLDHGYQKWRRDGGIHGVNTEQNLISVFYTTLPGTSVLYEMEVVKIGFDVPSGVHRCTMRMCTRTSTERAYRWQQCCSESYLLRLWAVASST
jgi:hypothetical protein